jgi:hypothetical protein
MENLLYLIAMILFIDWVVGSFAYRLGWIIHILLGIAIVSIIFRVIQENKILLNKI